MLYKIDPGYVQEQHYGLALARVVDLPPHVIEVATKVSAALEAQIAAKRQSSKAQAMSKRRKLVIAVRNTLETAATGEMEEKQLLSWVIRLQAEFIRRMDAIDNEENEEDVSDTETETATADNESVEVDETGSMQ